MKFDTTRHAVAKGFGVAGFALLLLTGCANPTPAADPTTAPDPVSTPPATEAPSPSPSPSAAALDVTCDELVPTDVLDTLASGFTPTAGYEPDSSSYASQIVSFGGVACAWTATSGDTLTVAVAQPTTEDLTTAETGIGGAGTASTLFGSDIQAWTINGGGTFPGDFEVFTPDGYWISTVSSLYADPESSYASTVVSTVQQNLPSG